MASQPMNIDCGILEPCPTAASDSIFGSTSQETTFCPEARAPAHSGPQPASSRSPIDTAGWLRNGRDNAIPLPNPSRQTRNRSLRADDWEQHRQSITFLYRDMRMKLKDLMIIMAENHNFHAPRHMYLLRIDQWGIKKTFRASQAKGVRDLPIQSCPLSVVNESSSNRLHLAKRDRRQCMDTANKGRRADTSAKIRHATRQDTPRLVPPRQCISMNPMDLRNKNYAVNTVMSTKFIQVPCSQSAEFLLFNVQDYVRMRLQSFYPPETDPTTLSHNSAPYLSSPIEIRLVSHLSWAHRNLRAKELPEAKKWLSKACDLAEEVLDNARLSSFDILGDLQGIWNQAPDCGKAVTEFFLRAAERNFDKSPDHYRGNLIHLFSLFLDSHHPNIIEAVGAVVLNTIHQSTPRDILVNNLIRRRIIGIYRTSGLDETALKMAKSNKHFCQLNFGPSHRLTHEAMSDLAEAHFVCDQFAEALEEAEAFMDSAGGTSLPLHVIFNICSIAGESCLALGRLSAAMYWFCLPEYHIRGGIVDKINHDYDFMFDSLEFSERMTYNIWRSQASQSNTQYLDDHCRSHCCLSCRRADDWFEKCAQAYSWPGFQYGSS